MKITTHLRSRLVSHFWLHGYDEIPLPHVYDADLFLTRAGEDVIQQLYTFDRRNRLLALRPEFTTAALVKFIREDRTDEHRWCFLGTNFSDQNGIIAEFDEIGAELYNVPGEDGDAEMLALAYKTVVETHGADCTVSVNHVGLLRTLLAEAGLEPRTIRTILANPRQPNLQYLLQLDDIADPGPSSANTAASTAALNFLERMHSRSTLGGRSAESIAQRFSQKSHRAAASDVYRRISSLLNQWCELQPVYIQDPGLKALVQHSSKATELLESWATSIDKAIEMGIPAEAIKIDITLSQRWEYYSGIAFKVLHNDNVIASGGRYDELAGLIKPGVSIPAIGFVCQISTLPDAARPAPLIVLNTHPSAATLANRLRAEGISTILSHQLPNTGDAVTLDDDGWEYMNVSGELSNIDLLVRCLGRS